MFAFPSRTRKEEAKNNDIKGNTLFITLPVLMAGASPDVRWLAERSAAAEYVIIVISASLGGWGATRSYTPEPRGWSTMLVVEAYSVGGSALYRWRWRRQKREVGENCEEL